MSRDALYAEQRELKMQLRGLSPKTGLYARIEKRLSELGQLLGGQKIGTGDMKEPFGKRRPDKNDTPD